MPSMRATVQTTTAAATRSREVGSANMCSSLDEQVFGVKGLAASRYAGAVLLRFRHRTLPRQGHPHMMGIVNVTPDSFYDGGATETTDLAVARALSVVSQGATVIDVGGMTRRPGAVSGPPGGDRDRRGGHGPPPRRRAQRPGRASADTAGARRHPRGRLR